MVDPLQSFRSQIQSPADAVRWACVLEATAPKAGNVYPGKAFEDLTHRDFLTAAEIAAEVFTDSSRRYSERIDTAAERTVKATGTNVNLGILLLMGPIVAADEALASRGIKRPRAGAWEPEIRTLLDASDSQDTRHIFNAIALSSPGGLGRVEHMDVLDRDHPQADLMEAMRLAQTADRVARQYATYYHDLLWNIMPVVRQSIEKSGDVLIGIARAHLILLALEPDTLIARKNGLPVALDVQKRAAKVNIEDSQSVAKFDALLRSCGHAMNPGTTADLIAAAMYLLLRTTP